MKNKDEQFRNNLKWIAAAGNIERYPCKSVISDKLKTIIYMVGLWFGGFLIGVAVGMNI